MIVKLAKAGGVAQLIECDDISYWPTAQYTIDLDLWKGGERKKRVIIGDSENPNAEWDVAYVMENGKTCDTIRQTLRAPR